MANVGTDFSSVHSSLSYLLSCYYNRASANLALLLDNNGNYSGRKVGLVLIGAAGELATCIMIVANGFFVHFSRRDSELLSGISRASLLVGSFVLSQGIFYYLKKHRPVPPPAPIPNPDVFSEMESWIERGIIQDATISQTLLPAMDQECIGLVQRYLGHPLPWRVYQIFMSMDSVGMRVEVKQRRDDILRKWLRNATPYSKNPTQVANEIAQFSDVTVQRAYFDRIYAWCIDNQYSLLVKINLVHAIVFASAPLGAIYVNDIFEKYFEELDEESNERERIAIAELVAYLTLLVMLNDREYREFQERAQPGTELRIAEQFLDSFGTKRTAESLKAAFNRFLYLKDHQAEREEWFRTWVRPRIRLP